MHSEAAVVDLPAGEEASVRQPEAAIRVRDLRKTYGRTDAVRGVSFEVRRGMGGTFGVAALGALFQHLASDRLAHTLAGSGVTAAQRDQIVHNIGSGRGVAGAGLDPQVAARVGRAPRDAFIHALSSGMWLSTGLALAGAVMALALVERKHGETPDPARRPEAAAEALRA
jgi:hypothetical protein